MEGSQLSSGRGSGWKNSIIKKGSQESRIITDSKEFPSKFSPSKNVEINPKIIGKSQILNYSHDQIVVGGRDRSSGKDSSLKRPATIITPKNNQMKEVKMTLKNVPSQKSLLGGALSPTKSPSRRPAKVSQQSMEFLHQIKLEYIRFKDKINKELKKLQNDIKAAIEEVMTVVQRARPTGSQIGQAMKSPSFQAPKAPAFSIPPPPFDSVQKATKPLAKPEMPQGVYIDTNKYRDLSSADVAIESVLPKIKQRMSKFFDLMGQLKTEINQQAMYSPVGSKTGQFGQ